VPHLRVTRRTLIGLLAACLSLSSVAAQSPVAPPIVILGVPAEVRDVVIATAMNAAAVEMEGAAVAQVCWQLGVPFMVIRSITDKADGSTVDAYRTNLEVASRNAATLTLAVIADLAAK
jgi:hypothetical protein